MPEFDPREDVVMLSIGGKAYEVAWRSPDH
jgi:hypothetical protein